MNNQNVRIVGLLLAAGAGSRFGGAYPGAKLDQLVDGVAVGIRSFDAMNAACDATIVIVREAGSALSQRARAQGAEVIVAEAPESGVGRSIAQGAVYALASFPIARYLTVSMADMPWIDKNIYRHINEILSGEKAISLNAIVQLIFNASENASGAAKAHHGRPGHPVAFGRDHWPALAALEGDLGARRVIEANREHVIQIATSDDGVWRDVDTPNDLG